MPGADGPAPEPPASSERIAVDEQSCPSCMKPTDPKRRCWFCFNRPCATCGVLTGGAFFPWCIAHQPPEAPVRAPAPPARKPERWVFVAEEIVEGEDVRDPSDWARVPVIQRVRHTLKYMLRAQGFRCVGLPDRVPDGVRVGEIEEG